MKKFTKKDFLRALTSLEKNGLGTSTMAPGPNGERCLLGHLAPTRSINTLIAKGSGLFPLGEEVARAALGTDYETAYCFNDLAQLEDGSYLRSLSQATFDEVATLFAFGAAGMFNEFQNKEMP